MDLWAATMWKGLFGPDSPLPRHPGKTYNKNITTSGKTETYTGESKTTTKAPQQHLQVAFNSKHGRTFVKQC